ncbi:MAG: CotH kinase family protein [Verrucomicrobiales bacterium]
MKVLCHFQMSVTRAAVLRVMVPVGLFLGFPAAHAGTYSQTFTAADGTAVLGDSSTLGGSPAGTASVQGNSLRLTNDGSGASTGSYKLPTLDTGKEVTEFTVSFQLRLVKGGTSAAPGEGFAMSFGALPSDNGRGEEGFIMPNGGISIGWDASDSVDGPYIRLKANGVNVRTILATALEPPGTVFNGIPNFYYDGQFRPVVIKWNVFDGFELQYAGQTVMSGIPTPGYSPAVNHRFGFTARTSATLSEGIFIDDLTVSTVPSAPIETGGPFITEFMADNQETREDENCEAGGWLEIYNGQNAAANLADWTLTDDPAVPAKWTLPSIAMQPYTYVVIWVDGKNRTTAPNYHANFSLKKTGGYLALIKPDGVTVASSYTYGPQAEDVSFGVLRPTLVQGYFETPTPGAKNAGFQAAAPASGEDVIFSRNGGLLAGAATLDAAPPTEPGAVVRYTLDNSRPHSASPPWPSGGLTLNNPSATGSIDTAINIRAAVFAPGRLPGRISSRTFIPLDASLTDYRGTGQPFNSNLPIIVFNSFGKNIDTVSQNPGARTFSYCYGLTIAPDPADANRAVITGPTDYQGRGGVHVRGETSSGFTQKPYSWELHDNYERDKDESILGLSADSDWALISNFNDKSVLRNKLPFDTMYEVNGEGSAMRERYVEVFFRQQDNGPLRASDYRGIYTFTERIKRHKDRVDIENLQPCDNVYANNPAIDDLAPISGGYIFRKDKDPQENAFTTSSGQQLQIRQPDPPTANQVAYIRGYMNRFETALNGPNFTDPVNGYAKYIDVDSFIDNHIWVEFTKQIDGYRLSTYWTKDRGGKVRALPIWDYNLSLGNADYLNGFNPIGWYYAEGDIYESGNYPWYKRLFADPEFNQKYWDRYWQLRRGILSTANLMARIDSMVNLLSDGQPLVAVTKGTGTWPNSVPSVDNPIGRHHARWQRLGVYDWPNAGGVNLRTRWNPTTPFDWTTITSATTVTQVAQATSEVNHVKTWLTRRLIFMDDQSLSFNKTTRSLKPPTLNNYGGTVPSGFVVEVGNPNTYGVTYYSLDGSDPRPVGGGLPANGTPSLGGVGATLTSYVLVDDAGTGDYLVPSETNGGSTLTIADWTRIAPPPNVGQWQTAKPLGIGFKTPTLGTFEPHIATNIQAQMQPAAGTANATVYLRTSFSLSQTQIDELSAFRLQARFDDGFIVYLNGTQLKRENTGTAPAVPQWNSASGTNRSDTSAVALTTITNLPTLATIKGLLVPGTNVLAFHGLNSSATNNDFLLKPRLEIDTLRVANEPATHPLGPLASSATLKLRIYDGSVGLWSPLTEASFLVGKVPANASNVVISEIHYHPLDPTATEVAAGFDNSNDFEFIEITNIASTPVDLSGCRFTDGITFDWADAPLDKRLLAPGARMVLCENPAAFASRYGTNGINLAGTYAGNLSNGGELIRLVDTGSVVIKNFSYDDSPPWPSDTDAVTGATLGYSIVLNNPHTNPDHGRATNWRSSATVHGAPGQSNGTTFTGNATDDTDGDGMVDFLEFATGSPINQPNPARGPELSLGAHIVDGVPNTYLQFVFIRNAAADGITCQPEATSDLRAWSTTAIPMTFVGTHPRGDGTVTEAWRTTQPAATLPPTVIARLRVQAVP